MYDLNTSLLPKWISSIVLIGLLSSPSWASDPFGNSTLTPDNNAPKEMAFDQVNWNRVQGVFSWITMARGYSDTAWDSSSGRPGWMTMEDAYVKPIDPGVSEFSSDTEIFYIVFEGQPLDAPAQFAAAWFEMKNGKVESNTLVGKDYPPEQSWKPGDYLVKIFYGSPGQALHDINIVGTMQFTIK
jgi:hypothetical protein